MKYFITHCNEIRAIMLTSGLSVNQARCLAGHLAQLERHNGIGYAVNILKGRIIALLNKNSDSYKRRDGFWTGPFRPISKLARRGRKGLKRALDVLKLFRLFRAEEASRFDYLNAQRSLAESTDNFALDAKIYPYRFLEAFQGIRPNDYDTIYPMSWRKAPLGGTKLPEVWVTPKEHIMSMDYFPKHVLNHYMVYAKLVGIDLPSRTHFENIIKLREGVSKRRWSKRSKQLRLVSRHDVAGAVTYLTKDGSLKLRLIANANRILQLAVSPVHNFCMEFLRKHPSSFVYDQRGGVEWVTKQFKLGYSLSSIDLKSASDNIPLLPQILFLKKVRPSLSESLDIFYEVSRMEFLTPHEDIRIRWTCGSPMGVKGSFGLFTVFLMSIFEYVSARDAYAIVGDDIVVRSSHTVAIRNSLASLNIPISTQKSLFDHCRFAEFCGKIIDAYGDLGVRKSYLTPHQSPIEIVKQYGRRALRWFPHHLSKKQQGSLLKFLFYQQEGVFDAFGILEEKSEKKVFSTGGLSWVQLAKLVQLDSKELDFALTRYEQLSKSEQTNYEKLRWERSTQALELLADHSLVEVVSWKILISHPAEAKLASFFGALGTEEAEQELEGAIGSIVFLNAPDVPTESSKALDGPLSEDVNKNIHEDQTLKVENFKDIDAALERANSLWNKFSWIPRIFKVVRKLWSKK